MVASNRFNRLPGRFNRIVPEVEAPKAGTVVPRKTKPPENVRAEQHAAMSGKKPSAKRKV